MSKILKIVIAASLLSACAVVTVPVKVAAKTVETAVDIID
jgi:hypothetical protein